MCIMFALLRKCNMNPSRFHFVFLTFLHIAICDDDSMSSNIISYIIDAHTIPQTHLFKS